MKAIIVRNSVEEYIMGILFIKDEVSIDDIEVKIGEFMESLTEKGGCYDFTTDEIIEFFPKEWEVNFIETSEIDDIEMYSEAMHCYE